MFGVVPLFTWGARADGFKMASRWWQRLDCGRGGFCVPPTPAVQKLKLHPLCLLPATSTVQLTLLFYHSPSVRCCSEPERCVSSSAGPPLKLCLISAITSFPSYSLCPLLCFPPSRPLLLSLTKTQHELRTHLQVMHGGRACVHCLHDGVEGPLVKLQCRHHPECTGL